MPREGAPLPRVGILSRRSLQRASVSAVAGRIPRESLAPFIIQLKGRRYKVAYTPHAVSALEQERGKTFEAVIVGAAAKNIGDLLALVRAGLQQHHAEEFPDNPAVGAFVEAVMRDPVATRTMGKLWTH